MSRKLFAAFPLHASVIAATMGFAAPVLADHVSATDTQAYQSRPTALGVSGSSQTLLRIGNLLYCYTGTLGALVEDSDGTQYILSNNHVLAKENENLAYGDSDANAAIIQEGNLDEGSCTINSGVAAHKVATLSGYVPIQFGKGRNKPQNVVDAAIAMVYDGAVDTDGYVLGIGTVNGVADPSVDMAVQKTGRTTAHTFGKVEATDVTIDVSYDSGTARFAHQLRIRRPCDDAGFSDAGDSGSLIVTVPTDENGSPEAVGLLFAGGSSDTFANPIAAVLGALSVSVPSAPINTDTEATMTPYGDVLKTCTSTSTSSGGGKGNHGHGPHTATGGPAGLDVARRVLASHSDEFFALPDVVGHGVGADASGNAVIEVYLTKAAQRAAGIPSQIDGVAVRTVVTGPIRAF